MPSSTIRGRRIAVTGGARGIGLATAKELHARGAHVVIGDIDGDLAKTAAAEVGPGVEGLALDVADRGSFEAFVAAATADGLLDVLINNAGIMPIGHYLEQDPAVHKRALEVNVLGCINGMSVVLPDMVARGRGHVINVASTAGKSPVPGGIVYCATKSAVVALTETARIEFAESGVSFTCVMPHFTNTDLIAGTTATKLIPVVEPADVAVAIAGAIRSQRKDVFVPKAIAPILLTQPLLGRRIRDVIGRRLGAYDTFLTFDTTKRASYDRRLDNS